MLSQGVKKTKSAEQALTALMRLCARAEKSTGDALRLMNTWGVEEQAQQKVLKHLIDQHFIDNTRYASAFVREKVRLSGWGALKIRAALQRKGIDRQIIAEALSEIDDTTMSNRLEEQLKRKSKSTKYATQYELKTKLIRYGLSLGFNYETVITAASKLTKETEECDNFL